MLPERYVPRKVSDIMKSDRLISIAGAMSDLDSAKGSFVIGDGTGKVEVRFNEQSKTSGQDIEAEDGKAVRAFCAVVGNEVHLDVLQKLEGMDLNLSKTVDELYSKAEV